MMDGCVRASVRASAELRGRGGRRGACWRMEGGEGRKGKDACGMAGLPAVPRVGWRWRWREDEGRKGRVAMAMRASEGEGKGERERERE